MTRIELIRLYTRRSLYIVFLLVGLLIVLSAVNRKQDREIRTMRIAVEPLPGGSFLLDTADVRRLIDRGLGYNPAEKPVGEVESERLERILESDPFVLDADVYVTADDEIRIRVEQREPVLRIIDQNGLNYYLDKHGNKMPTSSRYSARVLVATGNIPPHVPDFLDKKKHLLKDLFQLADEIRNDDFLYALTEQIHLSNGSFILIPKIGNHRIILGAFKDTEDKFRRLRVFYDEIAPKTGWRRYKTINLDFKGQVICEKW